MRDTNCILKNIMKTINWIPLTAIALLSIGCESRSPSLDSNGLPTYNNPTSGSTTLIEKCERLAIASQQGDFATISKISFQIGFEHDTPLTSTPDQDCASVGIKTDF